MLTKAAAILGLFCGLGFSSSALATDTGYEIIVLTDQSENGSRFNMLSFRMPLTKETSSEDELAATGPRLRYDVSRSTYETSYDSIAGEAAVLNQRLLLTYGISLGESSVLTVVGGLSKRQKEINPSTSSSPDGSDDVGLFIGTELEVKISGVGRLQANLESDETAGVYGSATYLHDFGILRIGPTLSRFVEADFTAESYGFVGAVDISDAAEVRVTAKRNYSAVAGGNKNIDSSLQVQLRYAF